MLNSTPENVTLLSDHNGTFSPGDVPGVRSYTSSYNGENEVNHGEMIATLTPLLIVLAVVVALFITPAITLLCCYFCKGCPLRKKIEERRAGNPGVVYNVPPEGEVQASVQRPTQP
ncbi:uncharacterized protein [Periplaneta americana]|uniref:uncharacterized protein n=1 Tax=Periplaneta americana TaxID=6978 RepID=UPI0037E8026D